MSHDEFTFPFRGADYASPEPKCAMHYSIKCELSAVELPFNADLESICDRLGREFDEMALVALSAGIHLAQPLRRTSPVRCPKCHGVIVCTCSS